MLPVTLEVEAGPALEPSSLRLANTARPHLKKIKQDIQLLIKLKTVISKEMITIQCGRCSVKKNLLVGPTDWPSLLVWGRLIIARQKGAAGISQCCKKSVPGKGQKMRFGERVSDKEKRGKRAGRGEVKPRRKSQNPRNTVMTP